MMDGLHQVGPGNKRIALLDVLYAEDFDDPGILPDAPVVPLAPSFSLADLEAAQADACRSAVSAARSEWEASASNLRASSLDRVAASVAAAQEGARLSVEEAAIETAKAMLSLLTGLLPHLCRLHGDVEVRALLRVLLPQLTQQPRIVVRVHPAVLDGVREDLRRLDSEIAAVVSVSALETLARGDARVGWTNGELRRDGDAIAGALRAGLAELGLLEPPHPDPGLLDSPEWRTAHAC